MSRTLVIADDFGFDAEVSLGILDVLARGTVDGAGCMVAGPAFAECAPALAASGALVGLHLDLNEFDGWAGLPIGHLIARAYSGRLDAAHVAACVRRQLDVLEAALGRAPDFIDGHQHVHQLPGVREALLAELARRGGRMPALRRTRPAHWRGGKAAVIGLLGGRALERQAAAQRIAMQNTDFAGVYAFDDALPYATRMAQWLGSLEAGGLVMTHPARPGAAAARDPIRAARWREHAFWMSDEAAALRAAGSAAGA